MPWTGIYGNASHFFAMGNGFTEMICTFQNRNAIMRRYKLKAIIKIESSDSLGLVQIEDIKLFSFVKTGSKSNVSTTSVSFAHLLHHFPNLISDASNFECNFDGEVSNIYLFLNASTANNNRCEVECFVRMIFDFNRF